MGRTSEMFVTQPAVIFDSKHFQTHSSKLEFKRWFCQWLSPVFFSTRLLAIIHLVWTLKRMCQGMQTGFVVRTSALSDYDNSDTDLFFFGRNIKEWDALNQPTKSQRSPCCVLSVCDADNSMSLSKTFILVSLAPGAILDLTQTKSSSCSSWSV